MKICKNCHKAFNKLHDHHLMSQKVKYRDLYSDFINDPKNIEQWCIDCHLSKSLNKLTELEFCQKMKIKPRSKTLLFKIQQGKIIQFW